MRQRRIMKVSADFDNLARAVSRNRTLDTGKKCSLIDAADLMAKEFRKNMRRGR